MTTSQPSKLCVSQDSFLFACIECDNARRLANGSFNSHLRYEPFLFGNYAGPKKRNVDGFFGEAKVVIKHHWNILPQFRKGELIDLETIAHFTNGITTLVADFESLLFAYTGQKMPLMPDQNLEPAGQGREEYADLEKQIGCYSAYLEEKTDESPAYVAFADEEDKEAAKEAFALDTWRLFYKVMLQSLPDYLSTVMLFVRWKYAPKTKKEQSDWTVRPPVGDEFIKWARTFDPDYGRRPRELRKRDDNRSGDRGRGRDDRPRHGDDKRGPRPHGERTERPHHTEAAGTDRPERHERTDRPERHERTDRPARHERTDRPERHERGGRFGDKPRDRGPQGGRGHGDRNFDRGPRQSSDELLQAALAEARDAMDSLSKSPNLAEVGLTPANSFIRHEQHALITEAGYATESRGEGRERCVFVKRPG